MTVTALQVLKLGTNSTKIPLSSKLESVLFTINFMKNTVLKITSDSQ